MFDALLFHRLDGLDPAHWRVELLDEPLPKPPGARGPAARRTASRKAGQRTPKDPKKKAKRRTTASTSARQRSPAKKTKRTTASGAKARRSKTRSASTAHRSSVDRTVSPAIIPAAQVTARTERHAPVLEPTGSDGDVVDTEFDAAPASPEKEGRRDAAMGATSPTPTRSGASMSPDYEYVLKSVGVSQEWKAAVSLHPPPAPPP